MVMMSMVAMVVATVRGMAIVTMTLKVFCVMCRPVIAAHSTYSHSLCTFLVCPNGCEGDIVTSPAVGWPDASLKDI